MKWKSPPLIKIYEAIGAISDGRIHLDQTGAKVYSSSGNKFYTIIYEPVSNSITSNDNGSYWVGYLGYPSIAYLLKKDIVAYDKSLIEYLKGFKWKDINQKFHNNFTKTQEYIDMHIAQEHDIDIQELHTSLEIIRDTIDRMKLNKLITSQKPPGEY